jgi:hypothetical protein
MTSGRPVTLMKRHRPTILVFGLFGARVTAATPGARRWSAPSAAGRLGPQAGPVLVIGDDRGRP